MCKHKMTDFFDLHGLSVTSLKERFAPTLARNPSQLSGAGWKTGQEITAPPWLWPQTMKVVGPFVDLSLCPCHDLEVTSPRPSRENCGMSVGMLLEKGNTKFDDLLS